MIKNKLFYLALGSFCSHLAFAEGQSFQFDPEQTRIKGNGCPEGSFDIVFDNDLNSASILFDEFFVSVPIVEEALPSDDSAYSYFIMSNKDVKRCNIKLAADIPYGYQVDSFDINVDFRGAVFADIETKVAFKSQLLIKEDILESSKFRDKKITKSNIVKEVWKANDDIIDDDFLISVGQEVPVESGCSSTKNSQVKFLIKNKILAKIINDESVFSPTASLFVDSTDVINNVNVKINYSECDQPY